MTAEKVEVPHLKMLKGEADKTFSASPPDLEIPLESEGLRENLVEAQNMTTYYDL